MKRIILLTDFTKAAVTAIKQGVAIALKTNASIMLLHFLDNKF
jgi:hypothetical protein